MKLMLQKTILYFAVIGSLLLQKAYASNGSANSNGNWGNPSTWLFNGTPRVPQPGDTVNIPGGDTVTVTASVVYSGSPMVVIVGGTLSFQTGKKLTFPCQSFVRILSGGLLDPGTGGGSSNFIEICGTIEWTAADGPVSGPASVGPDPLPISLVSFDLKRDHSAIDISWITADELNNDYFLLQRSADGVNYENLQQVQGAGTSTVAHFYSSVDNKPVNGLNYYRLCQVDYDGTHTLYPPKVIRMNGKADVIVCPNPATSNNISILFSGDRETTTNIEVKDIAGKTVYSLDNMPLQSGFNKIGLTTGLGAGTYLVTMTIDGEVYHQKAVISE